MVAVAIAALNFGVIRACYYDFRTGMNANKLDVLAVGFLPMANTLVLGILFGLAREKSAVYIVVSLNKAVENDNRHSTLLSLY